MKRALKTQVHLVPDESSDLWFAPDPPEISQAIEPQSLLSNPMKAITGLEAQQGFRQRPEEPWWFTKGWRSKAKRIQDPATGYRDVASPFMVVKSRKEGEEKGKVVRMTAEQVQAVVPSVEEFSRNLFFAANAKTFLSLNTRIAPTQPLIDDLNEVYGHSFGLDPIPGSCHPTHWCHWSCYAKSGKVRMSLPQRYMLSNLLHFHRMEKASKKDLLYSVDQAHNLLMSAWNQGYKSGRTGRPNLRLYGSGDLTPGAVRWLNAFAQRYPDFLLWGFTRRPEMAAKLSVIGGKRLHNIVMHLSIDPSSPLKANKGQMLSNPTYNFGTRKGAYVEDLAAIAKRRGWDFAYATHLVGDPYLDALRKQGIPITTVFGFHNGSTHTAQGDFFECPATHPTVSKYYSTVSWGDWARKKKNPVFAICQVCKWCQAPFTGPNGESKQQTAGRERPMMALLDPYFYTPGATPPGRDLMTQVGVMRSNPGNPPGIIDLTDLRGLLHEGLTQVHPFFRGM